MFVRRTFLATAVCLGLTACAVRPEPIPPSETLERVVEDRSELTANQEPVSGPVTIYEAIARALLYNLDQRLALMEQALQDQQLELVNFDMLPRMAASAGYVVRNNTNASSSESILSGNQSLEPSTSEDRKRAIADLSFSWNILDFGVSYFQAQQQADRVLIAEQRRRRVVNNLVQEVRGAFWQAATAERLLAKIDPLLEEGEDALQRAQLIQEQRLQPPVETLRFQKSLLEILRQLRGLRADLLQAKARLASLMNVEPGTDYNLQAPSPTDVVIPQLDADLDDLELLAMFNRPELREEDYQKRIGRNEVHTAMLRMLPGFSFDLTQSFDSNSFLVNNIWAEMTGRVTWNLIGLISGPSAIDAAEAQVTVADARRMALSMAVITQVNLAYRQYQRSLIDYRHAADLQDIEQRIFRLVATAQEGNAESQLERIRSAASAIAAELTRDQAFADLQSALGNIYASVGLDPLPEEIEDRSLDAVTAAVAAVARTWERAQFPPPPSVQNATDATSAVGGENHRSAEDAPAEGMPTDEVPAALPAPGPTIGRAPDSTATTGAGSAAPVRTPAADRLTTSEGADLATAVPVAASAASPGTVAPRTVAPAPALAPAASAVPPSRPTVPADGVAAQPAAVATEDDFFARVSRTSGWFD